MGINLNGLLVLFMFYFHQILSGNLFYGSTAFLIGPKRQVSMMLDPVRIYATAIYIASMIIALFCALYVSQRASVSDSFYF